MSEKWMSQSTDHFSNRCSRRKISKDNINDRFSFLFHLGKNVFCLVFVGKVGVKTICHYRRMPLLHLNIIEIYDAPLLHIKAPLIYHILVIACLPELLGITPLVACLDLLLGVPRLVSQAIHLSTSYQLLVKGFSTVYC